MQRAKVFRFAAEVSNLQEATAKIAGPYLAPGSGFIGVAAGMVENTPSGVAVGRLEGWLGLRVCPIRNDPS